MLKQRVENQLAETKAVWVRIGGRFRDRPGPRDWLGTRLQLRLRARMGGALTTGTGSEAATIRERTLAPCAWC
jgi:hypothetical protein